MSFQHSFDIEVAQKVGVDLAIFLKNLAYWINHNSIRNKHFHDGVYWMFNTLEAFESLFPYWSKKQIRNIIQKAKKLNLINIGDFNKHRYDRTHWYSLTPESCKLLNIFMCPDGHIQVSERAHESVQKGTPIPNSYTDSYKDIKSSCASDDTQQKVNNDVLTFFDVFWKVYPLKQNKKKAKQIWEKKKLDEKTELIVDDILARIDKHAPWKDGFIPHPTTYLTNERWTDEIQEFNAHEIRRRNIEKNKPQSIIEQRAVRFKATLELAKFPPSHSTVIRDDERSVSREILPRFSIPGS